MKIDLVIDATCSPQQAEAAQAEPRLPAFEAFVARGEPVALAESSDAQACLLRLYGLDAAAAPIAALTLLGDNRTPGADYWLRIDPVCLQANRTHLVLFALSEGDLSMAEAQALAASLATHVAADGHELIVADPLRWYLRCARAPRLTTRAPSTCTGQLAEDRLPSGPDAPYWRRVITEAQMLLHQAEVNVAREAIDKLPANGVWPWGGGCLVRPAQSPYQHVCSDDPLARGLALAAGAAASHLPRDADAALTIARAHSTMLIEMASAPGESSRLERDWLQPLAVALDDKRVAELRLLWLRTPHPLGRRLTRAHLKRWWRRKRPLTEYA